MTTNDEKAKKQTDEKFEEWFESTDFGAAPDGGEVRGMQGLSSRLGRGRPRIGRKITIVLPEETIANLTERATKKGIGYQTLARMILMESKDEEAS